MRTGFGDSAPLAAIRSSVGMLTTRTAQLAAAEQDALCWPICDLVWHRFSLYVRCGRSVAIIGGFFPSPVYTLVRCDLRVK